MLDFLLLDKAYVVVFLLLLKTFPRCNQLDTLASRNRASLTGSRVVTLA
jgi:hypothetical protein